MKDFVGLMVVCIVVVIGVGWFLLPGPVHKLFTPTVAVRGPEPKPEAEKEAKPVAKPHKPAARHNVEAASVEQPAVPVVNVRADSVVPVASTTPKAVPAPGEVKVGVERSHLIDSFGDPALSASTADRGHLFETFVYRKDRRQAVIRLQDGMVAAVFAR